MFGRFFLCISDGLQSITVDDRQFHQQPFNGDLMMSRQQIMPVVSVY